MHGDWAHPCHICAGTRLTLPSSACAGTACALEEALMRPEGSPWPRSTSCSRMTAPDPLRVSFRRSEHALRAVRERWSASRTRESMPNQISPQKREATSCRPAARRSKGGKVRLSRSATTWPCYTRMFLDIRSKGPPGPNTRSALEGPKSGTGAVQGPPDLI